ncbi:universal stress protein [Natrialbaceae archaeon AArc-T1-2]|uniref:universal stress protein n=1 Tax=Natrialbaceae archaeon AArc-T1-2 TaxID=3053904 RepID=UPI00255A752A|nr:universal stress protein [Natrialbaceae archaeon AArc-T1-2]WIV66707.1 universal stress protein [Natrialbaceae archaeon AArc-T1-2]
MEVLVAYDGSQPAQKAVEHAVNEYGNEELTLLRVIEMAGGSTGAGINLVQEKLKESREEQAADLTDELVELLTEEDVDYRTETVAGDPAREIVRFAEENDVDHVVVGSHGREGVSRVLLGSIAETVVRRAPTSVTVVR